MNGSLPTSYKVFPAHVGLSPDGWSLFGVTYSFPRTRGVEPFRVLLSMFTSWFSLHTWGCDTEKPLTIERQGLHFLALLPVPVFDGPLYLLLENLFG